MTEKYDGKSDDELVDEYVREYGTEYASEEMYEDIGEENAVQRKYSRKKSAEGVELPEEGIQYRSKRKYDKKPIPPRLRSVLLIRRTSDITITWVSRAVGLVLHAVMSGNMSASDAEKLVPLLRIALDSAMLATAQRVQQLQQRDSPDEQRDTPIQSLQQVLQQSMQSTPRGVEFK